MQYSHRDLIGFVKKKVIS